MNSPLFWDHRFLMATNPFRLVLSSVFTVDGWTETPFHVWSKKSFWCSVSLCSDGERVGALLDLAVVLNKCYGDCPPPLFASPYVSGLSCFLLSISWITRNFYLEMNDEGWALGFCIVPYVMITWSSLIQSFLHSRLFQPTGTFISGAWVTELKYRDWCSSSQAAVFHMEETEP